MLDFLKITHGMTKGNKNTISIFPKFVVGKNSEDLMIRGGDFYAVWDESTQLWSTNENVALAMIDQELNAYYEEHRDEFEYPAKIQYMWDADSGMIDKWHKYVQKQLRDFYHPLDETLIFKDQKTSRTDYASKKLPYTLEAGPCAAYDKLMSVLYNPPERQKIEWAIGSIISGDSKHNQKFIVMYGAPKTGKSTILNIIQDLFTGYWSVFDAKALGSASSSFALESLKNNPLVAIQHDGDLSRIEDNTRLNSIVSHETVIVNEKFKSAYTNRFNSFLFMGTNKPVKITDSRSGILRRLIDVNPSGNRIPEDEYDILVAQTKFELGAIAYHCLQVYENNKGLYNNYIPTTMLSASNDFYNFVLDSYDVFETNDETTLNEAWEMYDQYCKDAKVAYPLSRRYFQEELKNYFKNFQERPYLENGKRVRNYYSGFITDKFEYSPQSESEFAESRLIFNSIHSLLDDYLADRPAQYANESETPNYRWSNVTTVLKDLDTTKLHYVLVPENLIVIDFDIKDEEGNKCYEKNLEAASKWPPTYAELSKSGAGIHLHYFYDGDVKRLKSLYAKDIEIKVFSGNSSLRRKLSRCNDIPIRTIKDGLPLKEESKMVNFEGIKNEKALRALIIKALKKQVHASTKPNVDFINHILDEAYASGIPYDVTDMRPQILFFAASSTNQSKYCTDIVAKMKFKSEDESTATEYPDDSSLIFFDVEVFPNLFILVWKPQGGEPVKMINPSPVDIEELIKYKLVGFNCRRYDNHILYARMLGYSNEQLYAVSQKIINGSANAFFGEAYNISYTDIYDFSSKKQSLKKFEIELDIHHQELGLPWDQPVPEDQWDLVADYCVNDVLATEAVFNARHEDFVAREILADIAGGTVNDTTNQLTTKIIFGDVKNPQKDFVYTDLSTIFPGYTFENGHSSYLGEDPGEGGRVYAEPGMYINVALLDVASMHPTSIEELNLFGPYTKNFSAIKRARIYIKHHDYQSAGKMFNGKLQKWLTDDSIADSLSYALKIAINAVYGLTSAKFDNKCKDPRNVDNIVAKRGALFMMNLEKEVQKKGFTVAHIKTDSIKIPNATPEIIAFVTDYGKQYGYSFEHEATYSKMCLVNNAVYIAQYADVDTCVELYGEAYVFKDGDTLKENKKHPKSWTATGTQFQVPYVFKTLFSHEPLIFKDLCETKTVTSSLYLDMNEDLPEGEHNYIFVGKAGQFCPIKSGCGGGLLLREKNGKYDSATGTKGYRWLESEMVRALNKEDDIDLSYYESLADAAKDAISEFGDFNMFAAD